MTVIMVIMALAVVKLNNVTKTQLVNRTGQTFETGKVVRILEDNIQEDGMRVGAADCSRKDDEWSEKGTGTYNYQQCRLSFWCSLQSGNAGSGSPERCRKFSDHKRLFHGPERGNDRFCGTLSAGIVPGRRSAGCKRCSGTDLYLWSHSFIYLPVVYMGYSPFWTAVFICAITTAVTMYLIGGASEKTVCAVLGTISGVLIAGITATVFSRLSGITGWNVSDIESLLTLYETNDIQVGGLLFSGLLISTLGAVMDVAMSISSAMKEIYDQNHQITRMQLVKAGMRVGRDMMGTDSNTLILAFAGSSISMLIMDYAYHLPYLQIINSNNIGIALMQGLSGSFGIVLSVPATVAFAAWIYTGRK